MLSAHSVASTVNYLFSMRYRKNSATIPFHQRTNEDGYQRGVPSLKA